jgi:DNA-directed RNA polymerase subunit RPC12/RpoP
MVKSEGELLKCPNCGSQYKLVRVEAEPAASYGQIECPHCGGPLKSREGKFILKYSLLIIREGKSDRRAVNRVLLVWGAGELLRGKADCPRECASAGRR